MAEEKIFAEGFSFKRSDKAPDFVVGRLSMKVEEATTFLKQNVKNGWVNVNIKQARSGNYYVELDTYEAKNDKPNVDSAPKNVEKNDDEDGDLPF